MGLTGATVAAEERPSAADGRVAQLERELRIRDREERAARRELARATEQLVRQSRAARTQLEAFPFSGRRRAGRL